MRSGVVTRALEPAADLGFIEAVLIAEDLGEFGFFDGDDDPVDVGEDKRQRGDRPSLPQKPGFAEIGECESDIHRIAREAIRTRPYKLRGRSAGHRRGSSATKQKESPSCDDRARDEKYVASGQRKLIAESGNGGVMEMFERNAEQIAKHKHPWNRYMQEEPNWILH